MIALFDLDSLIYDALYRIISRAEARTLITEMGVKRARLEVIELAYNRLEQMITQVLTEVEYCTKSIDQTFYYITNNVAPIRNRVDPNYKKHRKKNKWANLFRNRLIQDTSFDIVYDLTWEADDLIYDKAARLRERGEDFIVISKDKDLKQIEGLFFDYYKLDTGKTDDRFNKIKEYRGLSVISKEDAEYLLAKQMLMGDAVDNIKGVPKIGEITAEKILKGKKGHALLVAVYRQYRKFYKHPIIAKMEFKKTYQLVKLGKK